MFAGNLSFRNIEVACEFLKEATSAPNLDLSNVDFIEPIFVAILKAMDMRNVKLNPNIESYVNRILQEDEISYTTVPIKKIQTEAQSDRIVKEIIQRLAGSQDYEEELFYILSELVINSLTHGQSPAIAYCQVYPNIDEIEIGVVDRGLGFLNTISRVRKVETYKDALKEAIKKGVSGYTKMIYSSAVKHAGMGLYIISEILKDCKGLMYIISGNAMYDVVSDKTLECGFNWDGSIVYIRLKRDEFKRRVSDYGIELYISMKLLPEGEEDIF